MKYYVVWIGRQTGVFDNWEECKNATRRYSNAKFKAYDTLALAELAYYIGPAFDPEIDGKLNELSFKERLLFFGSPAEGSYSATGSFVEKQNTMWWQVSNIYSEEICYQGGPVEGGTALHADFLAIAFGYEYLLTQSIEPIIYSINPEAIYHINYKQYGYLYATIKKFAKAYDILKQKCSFLRTLEIEVPCLKWISEMWGEIPGEFITNNL